MGKDFFLNVPAMVLICIAVFFQAGCGKSEPIPVGCSGQLSGAYADLGIKGRDGVLLAVEKINNDGGIAGRPVELLVRDDKGTPEGAIAADRELVEAGVVAIIGHMTSAQTMAAMNVTEKSGTVLLSPTASTNKLARLDDNFFRLEATNTIEARILARHVRKKRSCSRLAVIFDTDNAAYTDGYRDAFCNEYKARGGQVAGQWGFPSSRKPDFKQIATEIDNSAPDSLLIIASPLDTAIIAQRIRETGLTIPLFSSGWGQTDALLQHGGNAVEHLEIVIDFDSNSQKTEFQTFRGQYFSKFGREPTFVGGHAYEAMLILAVALEKTKGKKRGLREALQEIRNFNGLVGKISMDQYGDVIRDYFLHRVENGNFVTKTPMEP